MKPKPHRRLPKPKRHVIHPDGLSPTLMWHRTNTPRPPGAVTAVEPASDPQLQAINTPRMINNIKYGALNR